MSYKDFRNDLKRGTLGNVLFFRGAEDYLIEKAAEAVISSYVAEEYRNIDVRYLDGNTADAYDIMGEARAFSMFSDKRVVIVRNYLPLYRRSASPGGDELLEFAAKGMDTSAVIFTLESRFNSDLTAYGKKLFKACSGYEFGRTDRGDLRAFVTGLIRRGGGVIGRRELEYLIDLTGYYNKESTYDLNALASDVDKLVKAAGDGEITNELIEDLLIGDNERFTFDLVDAVVSGNRGRAMEIAETIIHEEDGGMAVIALLTKQFEIMYDALELEREGLTASQMARLTGVNEYRFKKAYQSARAYSRARLRELLIRLYNIDRDIKRGDIDRDIALELFAVTAGK